jgi:NTE family protein
VHNARKAVRDLISKLPEELKNDPSVVFLNEAAKENTVTVVHLIYRSKLYESSAKDYNFSRLNMIDHWQSGERDVHLSMRHTDWFERPQGDETMVTHDLTDADYQNADPIPNSNASNRSA